MDTGKHRGLTRRDLLKCAIAMPAAAWMSNFRALASPASRMVKKTAIKTINEDWLRAHIAKDDAWWG